MKLLINILLLFFVAACNKPETYCYDCTGKIEGITERFCVNTPAEMQSIIDFWQMKDIELKCTRHK